MLHSTAPPKNNLQDLGICGCLSHTHTHMHSTGIRKEVCCEGETYSVIEYLACIWHFYCSKQKDQTGLFRVTTSSPRRLHQSHPLIRCLRCLRCLSTTQQDLHGHTSLGNNLQLGFSDMAYVCVCNRMYICRSVTMFYDFLMFFEFFDVW